MFAAGHGRTSCAPLPPGRRQPAASCFLAESCLPRGACLAFSSRPDSLEHSDRWTALFSRKRRFGTGAERRDLSYLEVARSVPSRIRPDHGSASSCWCHPVISIMPPVERAPETTDRVPSIVTPVPRRGASAFGEALPCAPYGEAGGREIYTCPLGLCRKSSALRDSQFPGFRLFVLSWFSLRGWRTPGPGPSLF